MQNMSGGKTALGLDANIGALICYLGNLVCGLGLVYSIIVLVTDKTNKLPRFHAAQSLLLWVAGLIICIPAYVIVIGLAFSGSTVLALLGTLLWLVIALICLGLLVFTVISAIKAFGGEIYKVPFIGDYADKLSS
ncbi:MAG TPA: hypothetical protein VMZ26_13655 [Pyrinomonadaceae bacterium]|nr:hypothetical protein [Pyrinomonadaceae bacterium]